jgi:hypothetical protein
MSPGPTSRGRRRRRRCLRRRPVTLVCMVLGEGAGAQRQRRGGAVVVGPAAPAVARGVALPALVRVVCRGAAWHGGRRRKEICHAATPAGATGSKGAGKAEGTVLPSSASRQGRRRQRSLGRGRTRHFVASRPRPAGVGPRGSRRMRERIDTVQASPFGRMPAEKPGSGLRSCRGRSHRPPLTMQCEQKRGSESLPATGFGGRGPQCPAGRPAPHHEVHPPPGRKGATRGENIATSRGRLTMRPFAARPRTPRHG